MTRNPRSSRCADRRLALGGIAAGALRLADRALEAHAHDLGYEPGVWVRSARWSTLAQLSGDLERARRPLVHRARRCAIALARAIAATAAEAMLVPGELADGLACLLGLYLIATTLGISTRPRSIVSRVPSGHAG